MKKFLNMLRRAARDNRGSGLIMVLVCMICVGLLGATMLQMSYIGLRIKVTERTSTADFYDAAAAMDEIRAGLQEIVSDCVAEAYKAMLMDYNNPDPTQTMEQKFQAKFQDELKNWKDEALDQLLLDVDRTYNIQILQSFITKPDPDAPEEALVVTPDANAQWDDTNPEEIILRNVHVRYTDSVSHYVTDVTADIVLRVPTFTYILSEYSVSGLPEFAIIAKTALEQSGNASSIQGSAYAGEVNLTSLSYLSVSEGTLVSAANVNVSQEGRLVMNTGTTLWANGIAVDEGRVELLGTSYVADDLDLKSAYSEAQLKGRYFGFGNSTTTASQSSAILINSGLTQLDMSELERLMLAGYSFISNYYDDPALDAQRASMGESISTRRNQQAYLMPVSYLKDVSSNPIIVTQLPAVPELSDLGVQELAPYNGGVNPLYVNLSNGQVAIYYFIDFPSQADANAFFENYFTTNTLEIQQYLNNYTEMYTSLGIVETAGYTLQKSEAGTYTLNPVVNSGVLNSSVAQMKDTFNQLKKTLFDRDTSGGATNPYDHFVKTAEISALTNSPVGFINDAGVVEGYVVKGAYTIDGNTEESVRVIIASGNVSVTKDFRGLIISGGTISLQNGSNLVADPEGVAAALTATAEIDGTSRTLSEFLRDGVIENSTGDDNNNTGWNFNELVSYRNWDKNGTD